MSGPSVLMRLLAREAEAWGIRFGKPQIDVAAVRNQEFKIVETMAPADRSMSEARPAATTSPGAGTRRRPAISGSPGEARDLVEAVAECGRGALREQELLRPAGGHRCGRVEEEVDRDVLFLDVQLDEQLLEACVQVPVEAAQVVTERFPAVPGIERTQTLTAFRAYSRRDLEQAWDIGVE